MKIIGLGHYSRTGKDTLANAVVDHLKERVPHMRVAKRSFAWKLKQICYDLYAWDGLRQPEFYETLEGEKFRDIPLPTIGKTPVQIWVDMGTPAVREQVYQKTWIVYLLKGTTGVDVLIVPDVRFPNEVEAMQELGATLVKVVRPGYGPRKTVADRQLVGFTGWDFVVGSVGTMDSLRLWGAAFGAAAADLQQLTPQTEAEKIEACKVEVTEPWEPPTQTASKTLKLDATQAADLIHILNRYNGERQATTVSELCRQLTV